MKKLAFILTFCLSVNCAFATEASKYVEKQYSETHENKTVHITVKKEHTQEYQQKIGEQLIPAITYGYGDMKVKGCKKCRISYICLLDSDCNIIWGYVIPR